MITFGPVPSRRLGRSLGINNIPPKACTYSCVYCQLGPTARTQTEPRAFYRPEAIFAEVEASINAAARAGEHIDYLTFVPDGEPTLDVNLGTTIQLLRPLGLKIAVISNASLMWREDVRERVAAADWLSLKVDTVDEGIWRRLNRPNPGLDLSQILAGVRMMAAGFEGELATETMLVDGINDSPEAMIAVGEFLRQLNPDKAYLGVPTRPVAEEGITPPTEENLNRAFQIMSKKVARLEYLIGYEGSDVAVTGDLVEDLLSIASVHPLRQEAVEQLLHNSGSGWEVIRDLIDDGQLREAEFQGKRFYVRVLKQK